MADVSKVAYVFPGQGSQGVGMGRDLYDNFASAKAVFDQADDVLGFPLSGLCFDGPEDELRKTINAQPALVTASIACLEAIREVGGSEALPAPAFVAGHSLGEYTALAVAEVLDFATTVRLVRERGRLMYEAGLVKPGSMAAIIGLDEAVLAGICREAGVWIANINCPGQLVISGSVEDLEKAMGLAKAKGASRVVPLQVSGAFHTPLMQPAVDGMAVVMASVSFKNPTVTVVGNTGAQPITAGDAVSDELLKQLYNPVRWQRSVEYMIDNGVATFIEIGPGKVLSGLIKRINRETNTVNIGDLPAVMNLASRPNSPYLSFEGER